EHVVLAPERDYPHVVDIGAGRARQSVCMQSATGDDVAGFDGTEVGGDGDRPARGSYALDRYACANLTTGCLEQLPQPLRHAGEVDDGGGGGVDGAYPGSVRLDLADLVGTYERQRFDTVGLTALEERVKTGEFGRVGSYHYLAYLLVGDAVLVAEPADHADTRDA